MLSTMTARSFPPLRVACFAALLALVAFAPAPVAAGGADDAGSAWLMHGTWTLGRDDHQDRLWISLRCDNGRGSRHEHWTRLAPADVEGLDLGALPAKDTAIEFTLKRDAGKVRARGTWGGDEGAGTFDLELDPGYADALAKRGVGRPTESQHARLLLGDTTLGFLDALAREHYQTPDVEMLVRMTDHGVRESTVNGFTAAGYRLPSLDDLVQAIDHGVNPQFIAAMAEAGYRNLDFDLLLRARDHGASPEFIDDLAEAGYARLPLEDVIRARDHGVDGSFIDSLRRAGFEKLSLEAAIRARDHGVTSGYARRMREKRPDATLDEVIALRDRGVRP